MMDAEELELDKTHGLHEDMSIQQPLASPGVTPRIDLLPFSSPGALVTPRSSRSVASRVTQMEVQQRRSSSRSIKRKKFDDEVVESSLIKTERGRMKLPPPPPPPYVEKEKPEPVEKEIPVAPPPEKKKVIVTPHPEKKKVKISSKSHSSSSSSKRAKRQKPPAPASTKDLGRWKPQDDLALITAIQQREDADYDVYREHTEEKGVEGSFLPFGEERIFDPKLCLITTMECEKHERLLHGLCDLLKDVKTDLYIMEQDLEKLLTSQVSPSYGPNDCPVTSVIGDKIDSTVVSGCDIPFEQTVSKPLRRVKPLQRQETEPGSPNHVFMSNSYFRAMSNPCVCIPNLSGRLMKFDKHIISFLHKIDLIASKISQLEVIFTVTPASFTMKPFARFIHSVNTSYDFIEHLLDITTYQKNSNRVSQIEEKVEDIERGLTLGSSFLKCETMACRCCSDCVWLIRMFCGTSLRKLQNLKRQSIQYRTQLMKVTNDGSVQTLDPLRQKTDELLSQHIHTCDAATQPSSQQDLKPAFNQKPITVSGVHEIYKTYPQHMLPPLPVSISDNQSWCPPFLEDRHFQLPCVSSAPGNIPHFPSPYSCNSNQPWLPPMVSSPPAVPRQEFTSSASNLTSQHSFEPRSREPFFAKGSPDKRRHGIALREEDQLHLSRTEMLDHQVGLPFGGSSTEDQDYRNLPLLDGFQTPPNRRRYNRRNSSHNYRSFGRHHYRGDGYRRCDRRSRKCQLQGSTTTHIIQSFPEVDFASTPSQSSPLMSSSPCTSWSYYENNQSDTVSPFFKSRFNPVGQEMSTRATCEPSDRSNMISPPLVPNANGRDHCPTNYLESESYHSAATPSVICHSRPEPIQSVKQASVGKDSILLSPPQSHPPPRTVTYSNAMSSPPPRPPGAMATVSNLMSSPLPRPPGAMAAVSNLMSSPLPRLPGAMATVSNLMSSPLPRPPGAMATVSNLMSSPPPRPSGAMAAVSNLMSSPPPRPPGAMATVSNPMSSPPPRLPGAMATVSNLMSSPPPKPPGAMATVSNLMSSPPPRPSGAMAAVSNLMSSPPPRPPGAIATVFNLMPSPPLRPPGAMATVSNLMSSPPRPPVAMATVSNLMSSPPLRPPVAMATVSNLMSSPPPRPSGAMAAVSNLMSSPLSRPPGAMGSVSNLMSSPLSRPPGAMGSVSNLMSSPPLRPPVAMATVSNLMSSPPLRLPGALVTVSNLMSSPLSRPLAAMVTVSNPLLSPPPRQQGAIVTVSNSISSTSMSTTPLKTLAPTPLSISSPLATHTIGLEEAEQNGLTLSNKREIIDETVNVKSCSTFSLKSFNPLHKARKFMIMCKELTSRKKPFKLEEEGSSLWQQEDGFQWVELGKKSPSVMTTKVEKSSHIVEQEMKTARTSSHPRTTVVRTATAKVMAAHDSPTTHSTSGSGPNIEKRTLEGESPKTLSSRVKKSAEVRSPRTSRSPRVKKTAEAKSPRTRPSPRGKKSSEGRSPKTPSRRKKTEEDKHQGKHSSLSSIQTNLAESRQKMPSSQGVITCQGIVKKARIEEAVLSGPVDTKSGDANKTPCCNLPKPIIPSAKKPIKPLRKHLLRKDIELQINIVKNGGSPKTPTSSHPPVLRLPLNFKGAESSSKVTISTEQFSLRTCCSSSEHGMTSLSVPGDVKTAAFVSNLPPRLPPVSVPLYPHICPPAVDVEANITTLANSCGSSAGPPAKLELTTTFSNMRPIISLGSPLGITAKHKLAPVSSFERSVTSLESSPGVTLKPNLAPISSTGRSFTSLGSSLGFTPKPKLTHIFCVERPVASSVSSLGVTYTRNTKMTDIYHVSSRQTTAVPSTLQLTDVKCGTRATQGSANSVTTIRDSDKAASPMSTALQSFPSAQGNATSFVFTSQVTTTLSTAATLMGATSNGGITTSETAPLLQTAISYENAGDSESLTPDRLVIITNSNSDDDINITSQQKRQKASRPLVTSCAGRSTEVLDIKMKKAQTCHLDHLDSALSKNDFAVPVSASSASFLPSVASPVFKQQPTRNGHNQQINKFRAITSFEKSVVSMSSIATEGRTINIADTRSSTIIQSTNSNSITSKSSRIPSQVTRNQMFQSSKLSSSTSSTPVGVHHSPTLQDHLIKRTMTDIMSAAEGGSQKFTSYQTQAISNNKLSGKLSKDVGDLPSQEHRCCNSVQDILAEETLNKKLHHASSPKVHISRKRLRPDQSEVDWVIKDKEYLSTHCTHHVENPQKRCRWSEGVRNTLKSGTSESRIQITSIVPENKDHMFQEKVAEPDSTEGAKTSVNTPRHDKHGNSQKKPSSKEVHGYFSVRYAPLRKLRNTPPIVFRGKIYEQRVREILSFSDVGVRNAYDYQTCQILPAAIASASTQTSPRYFARELVFMIFTIGELQGRKIESHNTRNRLTQSQILNPTKISAVKDVVLHRFPIEEFHWQERCIPFINESLKSLFHRKLTHSAFKWIEGIQDCLRGGSAAAAEHS